MIKLGLIGADGRMGQAVDAKVGEDVAIVARVSKASPDPTHLHACDLIIDFSAPDALMAALDHLGDKTALISGTTGLSEDETVRLQSEAQRRPVLTAGNFSLGIAVLCDLAKDAARRLGTGWDVEIFEMHHRHKVDAPSGTALMLGEAVADGRGVILSDVSVIERGGARKPGDIGFSVLRGGGVYGLHEVRLVSESEMITLGHQALNRNVFADGALIAGRWLIGRQPGLYSLSDVIRSE